MKSQSVEHYFDLEGFYHNAEEIIEAGEKNYAKYALVSLDFDNFNFINDLFSYDVGNQVLSQITTYFSSQLCEGEMFSRLHADHFAFMVLIRNSVNVAERFSDMLHSKKFLTDVLPSHYNLVCSGGIVSLSDYHDSFSSILDRANFARKQAKGNHLNTFLSYDKKMCDDLDWRKIITLSMETALHEHEFLMYLQPKVLIKTNQIVGAEALVRWQNKKYGMIYPDRFIPILEQNGFITQLDFFMLNEACSFLKSSISNGIPPLPISVNFSKIHIRSDTFVKDVFDIVDGYKIPHNLIEIEFTENIYLDDFQTLVAVSSALKYLGFRVSLDDFGSAYSSLNYLKDLPLDIIKIDKGFLNSSTNNDKGRIIITKVVELIKSLCLVSVMEGVETTEQVEFLQKLSCDFGQGYFYARPMPADKYIDFVKAGSPLQNMEEYMKQKTQSTN